jgi:hypothetical protein
MDQELIYIATPYMATGDDPEAIKFQRFRNVTKFAADLTALGVHVYSPITHSHMMAMAAELPGDWDYWEAFDRKMLMACTSMIVYQQEGWEKSIGVEKEMVFAAAHGMPIRFIPMGMEIDGVIAMLKTPMPPYSSRR